MKSEDLEKTGRPQPPWGERLAMWEHSSSAGREGTGKGPGATIPKQVLIRQRFMLQSGSQRSKIKVGAGLSSL